jgi:hypothetical protein
MAGLEDETPHNPNFTKRLAHGDFGGDSSVVEGPGAYRKPNCFPLAVDAELRAKVWRVRGHLPFPETKIDYVVFVAYLPYRTLTCPAIGITKDFSKIKFLYQFLDLGAFATGK